MQTLRPAAGKVALFFLRPSFWPFSKFALCIAKQGFGAKLSRNGDGVVVARKASHVSKSHNAGAIVEDIFLVDFHSLGCFVTVVLEIECQEK